MRYVAVNCKFTPEQHQHLQAIVDKYGFSSTYELLKLLCSMLIQYTDYETQVEANEVFSDMFKKLLSKEQYNNFKASQYSTLIAIDNETKAVKVLNRHKQTVSLSPVRLLRVVVDVLFPALANRIREIADMDNYAKVLCEALDDYLLLLNSKDIAQCNNTYSNHENRMTDASRPKRADNRTIYSQDEKNKRLYNVDERNPMA